MEERAGTSLIDVGEGEPRFPVCAMKELGPEDPQSAEAEEARAVGKDTRFF